MTGTFAHQAAASTMGLSIQCVIAGLSVEQANGFLGALPTPAASAAAQANGFAAAMATLGRQQRDLAHARRALFQCIGQRHSCALMPTLGLAADLAVAVAVSALTQRTAATVDAATPLEAPLPPK